MDLYARLAENSSKQEMRSLPKLFHPQAAGVGNQKGFLAVRGIKPLYFSKKSRFLEARTPVVFYFKPLEGVSSNDNQARAIEGGPKKPSARGSRIVRRRHFTAKIRTNKNI
jgi:hypothetical protein